MDYPCLSIGGGLQSQVRRNRRSTHGFVIVFAVLWLNILCWSIPLYSSSEDWQSHLRQLVQQQDLTSALTIAEGRLAGHPDDLEARGWRARLLAWTQRWNESEIEYRAVLQSAPHDMDILIGLADLLIWQKRSVEALTFLDQAIARDTARNDVQLRRGRLLHALGRRAEAGAAYSRVFALEGLFQRLSDDTAPAMKPQSIAADYGNRSFAPPGSMHGDSFQWDWQRGLSAGSISDVNGRFYRRFGLAASPWDPTDSFQTYTEFLSGGRPHAGNGMNYAIRF